MFNWCFCLELLVIVEWCFNYAHEFRSIFKEVGHNIVEVRRRQRTGKGEVKNQATQAEALYFFCSTLFVDAGLQQCFGLFAQLRHIDVDACAFAKCLLLLLGKTGQHLLVNVFVNILGLLRKVKHNKHLVVVFLVHKVESEAFEQANEPVEVRETANDLSDLELTAWLEDALGLDEEVEIIGSHQREREYSHVAKVGWERHLGDITRNHLVILGYQIKAEHVTFRQTVGNRSVAASQIGNHGLWGQLLELIDDQVYRILGP